MTAEAAPPLRDRMQDTLDSLLGQAQAIKVAAEGPGVKRAARRRAADREGGIRDAVKQMQETLKGDDQA